MYYKQSTGVVIVRKSIDNAISIPRRDTGEIVSFITGWMVYPDGRIQLTTPYGGK